MSDTPERSYEVGHVAERTVLAEVWHSAAMVVLAQRSMCAGESEMRLVMTPFEARQVGGLLVKAADDAARYARGGDS